MAFRSFSFSWKDIACPCVITTNSLCAAYPSFVFSCLGKPRAASVVARRDGVLWQLHRTAFKAALQSSCPDISGSMVVKTLRSMEQLVSLTSSQLQQLADKLVPVNYNDGEYIVRQGDSGDDMFIVDQVGLRVQGRAQGSEALRLRDSRVHVYIQLRCVSLLCVMSLSVSVSVTGLGMNLEDHAEQPSGSAHVIRFCTAAACHACSLYPNVSNSTVRCLCCGATIWAFRRTACTILSEIVLDTLRPEV